MERDEGERAATSGPGAARGAGEVYAALDLGTNNCRLLLATPRAGGFRVVEAYSAVTRLGEGLAGSGMLGEAAMARTLVALRHCGRRMESRRARRRRVVATEACRRAANRGDFVARVAAETGLAVEIISPAEEAALTLAGCAALLAPAPVDSLIFDIGGGSTELIHARADGSGRVSVAGMLSEPTGVVTLSEQAGAGLAEPATFAAEVARVAERLAEFERASGLARLAEPGALQLLGTSGTVTTLAGVHLGLARYDRRAVDGLTLPTESILETGRRVVALPPARRAAQPCIGAERAGLIVAGCVILEAIVGLWPAPRLMIADRGLREGLLLTMMAEPASA